MVALVATEGGCPGAAHGRAERTGMQTHYVHGARQWSDNAQAGVPPQAGGAPQAELSTAALWTVLSSVSPAQSRGRTRGGATSSGGLPLLARGSGGRIIHGYLPLVLE
jgi:hypothetical protein